MESNELSGKRIALWGGAALIITLVLIVIFKLTGNGGGGDLIANIPPITERDHLLGNASSTITLIEYSDFQCPACAAYAPLVDQVMTEYSETVRFTYRHFPLSYHQQAEPAAYASEAAAKQGKFWEMYRKIFENQAAWADNKDAEKIFESYATGLGLDMQKYKQDFSSADVKDKVKDDYQSGLDIGVNATPSFYLNGKKITPQSYENFKSLIDGEISKNI